MANRLGLAHVLYRCLVSTVELVLLDDCLAAVDVHVARAICEEALLGILLDGNRSICLIAGNGLKFAALAFHSVLMFGCLQQLLQFEA